MKRMAVGLLLLVCAFALATAQTIQVTAPKGGESWTLGTSKVITWTAKNFPAGTKARLVLLLNGAKVGDIAVSVPIAQGSWKWAKAGYYVGGTAAAGSGYAVRVRDMNNQYPGAKSPTTFTLASLSTVNTRAMLRSPAVAEGMVRALNTIPVSSPGQGQAFEPGTMFFVVWDKSQIAAYPQVAVDVFTPDKKTKVGPISPASSSLEANTGKYDAIVFNDRFEWGKDYAVRVATPDEKYVGWSGVFHITPLTAVAETQTFTGAYSLGFSKSDKSWYWGCPDMQGEAIDKPPTGFYFVGWENWYDDPTGPCWLYRGSVYRTVVDPPGIYQGFKVTKAVLRFAVTQGTKQPLYVLRRDAPGDTLSVPATTVATVASWGFGSTIEVDVTAVVQAWCTGQAPNRGLIIRGGDESFGHDNAKARCTITPPELIITQTVYK